MWFIGVEVEQETSSPPPKKKPGSAPDGYGICFYNFTAKGRQSSDMTCYSYGLSILAFSECKAEVDLF